jgi:DNA-binding response OmpR family regulator
VKPGKPAVGRPARPCILIVDDHGPVRARLSVQLIGAGYEVLLASHGARALQLAADRRCDLVLTEVNLPDMCGLQFCHRLRENPGLGLLPVVFMSRRPDGNLIRLMGQTARARYLPKPMHRDILLAALRAALREGSFPGVA